MWTYLFMHTTVSKNCGCTIIQCEIFFTGLDQLFQKAAKINTLVRMISRMIIFLKNCIKLNQMRWNFEQKQVQVKENKNNNKIKNNEHK